MPKEPVVKKEPVKLNLGSGRIMLKGYTNIDRIQMLDGNGNESVHVVMDIEKEFLPYKDNSVDDILVDNVLEHLEELKFVMNECWRVLKTKGKLHGVVPVAGTEYDFMDPTHKRHFAEGTFRYFQYGHPAFMDKPKHPKYADYEFKPWQNIKLEVINEGRLIQFSMKPYKKIWDGNQKK